MVFRSAFPASTDRPCPPDSGLFPQRVQGPYRWPVATVCVSEESGCLRLQPKFGGRLHLRLSTDARPIDDKYREGKLKRTLKREFKST